VTSSLKDTRGPADQQQGRGQVSLATLSEHLGLSAAAISRVLNGAPAAKSIPKVTQERIFAAAQKFNYRPNGVARSLRRGRSMTIGVLVPEISEGYATLVLSGLEHGLLEAGYVFFLISHHHQPKLVERSQAMLAERAVDGIVAIDTAIEHAGVLPTVAVSCPEAQEAAVRIVLNHRRAAELALDHLADLGHREIAVIKGQSFSSDTELRFGAIRAAASRLNLCLRPELMAQLEGDGPSHEPGYLATQRLLKTSRRFTALFAFNDVSAIGAIRSLREAGLRVPEDVSVIGFDDVQSAAFQNPALTTIRQPLHAMGLLAAEAIVGKATSPATLGRGEVIVVEPELIVRESTSRLVSRSLRAARDSLAVPAARLAPASDSAE